MRKEIEWHEAKGGDYARINESRWIISAYNSGDTWLGVRTSDSDFHSVCDLVGLGATFEREVPELEMLKAFSEAEEPEASE